MRTLLKVVMLLFAAAWWLLSACVRRLWRCFRGQRKPVHGDAAFATPRELKRGGYLKPRGFLAGVCSKGPVYLDDESSALIFGSRGAGKTQHLIAALKTVPPETDLIIADPVGDIERVVDLPAHRKIRLDLTNPHKSDKYDPLTLPVPELSNVGFEHAFNYSRDVMTLCGTMIASNGRENDAGLHFLESARAMLQSMMMWRAANPRLGFTVSDIVVRLVAEKRARNDEFTKMRAGTHVLVRQGVEAFEGAGDRERGSMDSTLSRKLRSFLDDAVRYVTTVDANEERWSFEDIFRQKRPVAVFIRTGLGNEEFGGPLVRLVVGNAINTRRRMWNRMSVPEGMPLHQCVGREFPKPLWIFVDEARSMGNCEAVVDAVNELRKARVNAFLTFHTLADVKETYSSPQALLNGCAWIINGGSRDLALYKEASALAGDTTVMSHSFSKGEKKSESEHEISRPVVKPDELQRLAPDESVVIAHGLIAKLKKPWRIQKGTVRYL